MGRVILLPDEKYFSSGRRRGSAAACLTAGTSYTISYALRAIKNVGRFFDEIRIKWLAAALALCIVLSAAGCGAKQGGDAGANPDSALINKSIGMAQLITQKADSDIINALYRVNMDEVKEYADQVAAIDATAPQAAWVFTLDAEGFLRTIAQEMGDLDLPEAIMDTMIRTAASSLPNMLASQMGTYYIVFTSVTSVETAFIKPTGFEETTVVLLVYEGEFATLTTFVEYEDGVLVARSSAVPNMGFTVRNATRELDKILRELGQRGVNYQIYEGVELEALLEDQQ